jgi:NTE family protein
MWKKVFIINTHLTLQPMIYGRVILGDNIPYCQYNVIGGNMFGHYLPQQLPFAGIGNAEYVENTFVGCQLFLQQRIMDNNYVAITLSAAQHSGKLKDVFENGPMMGYKISYAYDSFFGPIGASIGYSSHTSNLYFYLNLGYEF